MKKILSCVLAIALVFSLMSMTVFASDTHPTPKHDGTAGGPFAVVGTHGQHGDLTDGVDFNNATGTSTSDITVNFNGQVDGDGDDQGGTITGSTIINKYAIDITYKALVIDLTEIPNEKEVTVNGTDYTITTTYTWDVNNYVYVPEVTTVPEVKPGDEEGVEDATTALTDPITIDNAYYITNHSDLPVYYKSALTNTYDTAMTMTLKDTDGNTATGEGFYMVDRATAGTYVSESNINPGSARNGKTHYIEAIPVTGSDWLTTINALAGTVSNGDPVGSITINFAATTGAENSFNYTAS